jgi:hypothetical protein
LLIRIILESVHTLQIAIVTLFALALSSCHEIANYDPLARVDASAVTDASITDAGLDRRVVDPPDVAIDSRGREDGSSLDVGRDRDQRPTTDGAGDGASDGADASDGATTDGATTDGATTDGATTDGQPNISITWENAAGQTALTCSKGVTVGAGLYCPNGDISAAYVQAGSAYGSCASGHPSYLYAVCLEGIAIKKLSPHAGFASDRIALGCDGTDILVGGGCNCGTNHVLASYPSADGFWNCRCQGVGNHHIYTVCATAHVDLIHKPGRFCLAGSHCVAGGCQSSHSLSESHPSSGGWSCTGRQPTTHLLCTR